VPRWSSIASVASRVTGRGRALEVSDVFVAFTCLYLLTANRSPPFGDARPMWEAAENLVRHGSLAIELRWPVNAPAGVGGRYQPVAALLAVLVHVPGALLQRVLVGVAPDRAQPFVAVTSQLAPILIGASVPAFFFRLLGRLGYTPRQAALATLLLGTGTSIWVYAHRPYSEIVQAAAFLLFLGALLEAGARPTMRAGLWLGLAAGALVNTKNIYFVCLPGAVGFVAWRLRAAGVSRRVWRTLAVAAAAGFVPGLAALGLYNHLRWGSVLASGYGGVTVGFWREELWTGLWGPFLSPGKSVFLYSPPLLAALWGARRLWQNRRPVAVAVLAVVVPVVLVYARYLFWSGDWAWGPRYLVFALPALLLPVAELFAPTATAKESSAPEARAVSSRRAGGVAILVLGLAGVGVQCLGNVFYWDDFINISRQAQQAWLGRPDVSGTPLAPAPCFSCFEEVYGIEWLPPMQPIAGHWWLLRHKVAGDDWKVAEADAPWKRYTSTTTNLAASYDGADIDWWPLGAGQSSGLAVAAIALLLLLAIPLRPWLTALRPPT
jgi:hypothetical protein